MTDHAPPQNLIAEESVLGALMHSSKAMEEVVDVVKPKDFYRESHSTIFAAAVEMFVDGTPIDPITLTDHLEKTKRLNKAGGQARIHELAALSSGWSNVQHYAKIVSVEATRRNMIHAGQLISQLGQEGGDQDDLLARAESIFANATILPSSESIESITEGLDELIAERREAFRTGKPIFGERTGFSELDNMLSGFWPGQLIVLAARPSVGKSALALNIAENFADRGVCSMFQALEMSKFELQIRGLSRAARIDGKRIQTGMLRAEDAIKLPKGIERLEARSDHLFIDDNGGITLPQLRANATRFLRQKNMGLLVVDYIQLMHGTGDTRNEQVAGISRGLKLLARQLNIPILALSQMSRAIEQRADKRPTLSDLRDSGAIEQDADVVMFMHDPAANEVGREANGDIEIIVEKNRKGERGTVNLLFLRRFSEFQTPSLHPPTKEEA